MRDNSYQTFKEMHPEHVRGKGERIIAGFAVQVLQEQVDIGHDHSSRFPTGSRVLQQ